MAKLSDVRKAVKSIGSVGLGKRVFNQVMEDDCFTLASSMAYSWLFAIFPFFIFLLALVPYIPFANSQQANDAIAGFMAQLPNDASSTLQSNIDDLRQTPRGGVLSIGIFLALWVASGGMATTMGALATCYDVPSRPFYKQRPVAMGLTVIVVMLILGVIILLPGASIAKAWIASHPDHLSFIGGSIWPLVLLDIGRYGVALLMLFAALSVIYYFGPPVKQTYRFITPGAVFTVFSWLLMGLGFRWYVNNFANYNATYGALGGVIILLLVFYLDSLLLLVGAEINSELDLLARPQVGGEDDFEEKPEIEDDEAEIEVQNDTAVLTPSEQKAAQQDKG